MIRRHLFLLIFYTRKDRKGQQEVEQTGKKSKEMDMLNGGLAVGPNAALANLIGQKNRGKINSMVHTILTFGAVLGISLMVIGMLVARVIPEASDVLPDRVRMFTS